MRVSGSQVWGPVCRANESETFRANSKLMGTLRDGEWQVSLNWSENKAIERWSNLVDAEKLALGLGSSSALCQHRWLCAD